MEEPTRTNPSCRGKEDGEPCAGRAIPPSEFCILHGDDKQLQDTLKAVSAGRDLSLLRGLTIDDRLFDAIANSLPVGPDRRRQMRAPDLVGSRFTCGPRFDEITIMGPSLWTGATFELAASFNGVQFINEADFTGVSFGGVTDFRRAAFLAGATFDGATFLSTVDFSEASAGADVLFLGTRFMEKAIFPVATHSRWRVDWATLHAGVVPPEILSKSPDAILLSKPPPD